MTLTTTAPVLASELATRITQIATDVNSLWAQNAATTWISSYLALELAAGATSIAATDVPIEVIGLTGAAAISLSSITGGRSGMIKIIIADDANITVIHGTDIVLAGAVDLPLAQNDIIALVNRDGDPTTLANGTWRELFRILF